MADRGLSLSEALYGESHFETATWLNNVGELLLALGRHQECCDYFAKAHRTLHAYASSLDRALDVSNVLRRRR